ncbi:hypothetical protein BHE74_00002253 [Ensete ventricosum]|nr:hypothetical protein BHE74_00002253 [Ensete ventricosum]
MALINHVHNVGSVIHQQGFIINDLQKEIKRLKKVSAPATITEAEARGANLRRLSYASPTSPNRKRKSEQ